MKFRRPTFSQKVTQIRKDRREKLVTRGLQTLFVLIFSGLMISNIYLAKVKEHQKAPTWAEFINDGSIHESVSMSTIDGIPSVLNINGDHWNVVRVDAFKDALDHIDGRSFNGVQAQTYCREKLISYIETQNITVLKENLWHEVMHAGACTHGGDTWWNSIDPTQDKHEGIKHLGEFLSNFTKVNPNFVAWASR